MVVLIVKTSQRYPQHSSVKMNCRRAGLISSELNAVSCTFYVRLRTYQLTLFGLG